MNESSALASHIGNSSAPVATIPSGLLRKALLVTFCAVAIYCGFVAFSDFRAIGASLQRLSLARIVLALSLVSTSFGLRFLRWRGYLRAVGITVSETDSALIFASGLGMSITPGKAGELLKSLMLQQAAGTPLATSVPIVAAERITDAMALLLLGAIGLSGTKYGTSIVLLVVAAIVALSLVLSTRVVGQWFLDLTCRIKVIGRHRDRLSSAHSAILKVCAPVRLLQAFVWALMAWTLHSMCLLTIAHAFEGTSLTLTTALAIDAAPLLAGAFAMLPGGLGLTEASMAGALIAFGAGAISTATAAAITLAVRIITLWWAVVIGFTALGIWQLRRVRQPA